MSGNVLARARYLTGLPLKTEEPFAFAGIWRVLSQSSILGAKSKIGYRKFNDLQTAKLWSRTWPLRIMFRDLSPAVRMV
jgi:hypothetical protein